MAVSHIYSSPVADATGTQTIWNGATTATVAASDLILPSHWNSAHNQVVDLTGNTVGVAQVTGTNIVFGGSNNVTLSGVQGVNAGTIHISAAAGGGGGSVNISAGTTSNNLTNFVFADGNGVSFGLNGSTVTATVATNYLTTARASNDAIGLNTAQSNVTWTANSAGLSLDARGYAGTGTTFNGANISGSITQNSAGLNLSLSVAPGGGAGDGVNILAAGTQTANTTGTVLFQNSNGVTFGMSNSSVITASYTVPSTAGLISAVNLSAGTTSNNLTALTLSNSNGLAFGLNGSVVTGSYTVPSITSWTVSDAATSQTIGRLAFTNSNGLTLSLSTSNNGNATVIGSYTVPTVTSMTVSDAATSGTLARLAFTNLNGVTLSLSTGAGGSHTIVGSHNALTTARASTDAIGLNTAQSNVTWTVNSSGLSLDARGYAGTGTTFAGANVSGSMTVNSNGVNLSLSGVGGGTVNQTGPNIGVSNLGNTAGSTGTVSTGNVVLVGSNGITLSQSTGAVGSAATITILGNATTIGGWEPIQANNNTTFSSMGQNTLYLQKMVADANYSFNNIEVRMSGSFASSTNAQTVVHTIRYGLYSLNTANNSYSSLGSSSLIISASYNSNTAMGYTISQGAGSYTTTSGGTAIASLMTGVKHLYMPFTSTLSEGIPYGVVFHISSASTGSLSAHRMSILNQTIINNLTIGRVFASSIIASNASHVGDYEQGVLSATTAALPAAIAKSDMTAAVSQARLYIQFDA